MKIYKTALVCLMTCAVAFFGCSCSLLEDDSNESSVPVTTSEKSSTSVKTTSKPKPTEPCVGVDLDVTAHELAAVRLGGRCGRHARAADERADARLELEDVDDLLSFFVEAGDLFLSPYATFSRAENF